MDQQDIINIIQQLTGQRNILTMPVMFVELLEGDHKAALFLSQLCYWSGRSEDGWVYKTYTEWEDETKIRERSLRTIKDDLERRGLIETSIRKARGAPTLHYRVRYDEIVNLIRQKAQVRSGKNVRLNPAKSADSTITETTAETTTEKGHKDLVDLYFKLHQAKYGEKPLFRAADGSLIQKLLSHSTYEDIERKLKAYYGQPFWFNKESHDIKQFFSHYNEIVSKSDPWQDPSKFTFDDDQAQRQDRIMEELGL